MNVLTAMQRVLRGETVDGFPMQFPPPVGRLLGLEPVAVEKGSAVFRLQARRDKHANPMGTLHGGILCDLADAAMGLACASLLDEGESFTTLELKINFFRPVFDALLEARARAVHSSKSLVYLECDVVALPDGKPVAKAASTCLILRGEQAKGRGGG
ncbi:MAG TPA: PaaI family thioesterase [Thermoanaerobaculia bacterium]|nr:PaaI family thioesterase [Thermoanaerobaculia bacterium]